MNWRVGCWRRNLIKMKKNTKWTEDWRAHGLIGFWLLSKIILINYVPWTSVTFFVGAVMVRGLTFIEEIDWSFQISTVNFLYKLTQFSTEVILWPSKYFHSKTLTIQTLRIDFNLFNYACGAWMLHLCSALVYISSTLCKW